MSSLDSESSQPLFLTLKFLKMNSTSKILCIIAISVLQMINVNGQDNTFPDYGNAGIGTLTPTADLEIIDDKIPHLRIGLDKTTRLELGVASVNGYFASQSITGDAVINTLGASRNLIFNTADSPGKGEAFKFVAQNKSLFTITDDAKVGVGTHNPVANLHVIGKTEMQTNTFSPLTFSTTGVTQVVQYMQNGDRKAFHGLVNSGNFDIVKEGTGNLRLRVQKGAENIVLLGGNVGIGMQNPAERLHVQGNANICGQLKAEEVKVEDGWCDYVFDESYQLPTLKEEAQFIKANGHLSGFESEATMDGQIKLGDVTKRQQETIEKLMLHMIELDKEIRSLKTQIDSQ